MKRLLIYGILLITSTSQAQTFGTLPAQGQTITQTLLWSYGGYRFTKEFTFNQSDYLYYKGLSKTQPYQNYATEHESNPYLLTLARQLDDGAKQIGIAGGSAMADYIIAFVQQAIPYVRDPYNNGRDYPKYPIETIVERSGDCEDTAALLVALLKTFGFDAVMVAVPGHMAAAISCATCNGYYPYQGKKYAFIETTNPGWRVGVVPPENRRHGATILQTARLTRYRRGEDNPWNNNNRYPDKNDGEINRGRADNEWWNDKRLFSDQDGRDSNRNTTNNPYMSRISTVTINGTSYLIKGSGTTTINANGITVVVTTDQNNPEN